MAQNDKLPIPDWMKPPLRSGGGDGTSSDMEARVKRLEDDYKELRADLKSLLIDMAVLKERVSHLPSKGWAVTVALSTIGVISTVVTLAPKLQSWLGITPH